MPKFLAKFTKNIPAQLLIIVCLTTLAYINIFQNQFVIDDKLFILRWQAIKSFANIGNLLSRAVPAGHEGVYRPLRSLLYLLYYHLFGTTAFFYHLHSLIVHLLATLLVYLLVKEMSAKKGLAFVSSLIFGIHPIHTEMISYISASMEATGIVFFLASFYLYLKKNSEKLQFKVQSVSSVVLSLLAFFTYEMTLTLPLLIIVYRQIFPVPKGGEKKFQSLIYSLPYFLAASAYLLVRFLLLKIGARGPYLANSWYLTMLTMSKVLVKYLFLTILPINQANNHIIYKGIEAFVYRGYRTAAIKSQSLTDLPILLSTFLIFALLTFAVRMRKKSPLLSFGILWFFISLLPVMEIIPQGSILNEKFLYLPSIGIILVAAVFIYRLFFSKYRYVSFIFIAVISTSFCFLTYRRNLDWQNEISLWSKDVAVYPKENAYAYFALGNAYRERGNIKKAIANYQQALAINPHFAVAKASIAKTYQDSGQTDLAIMNYQQAIAIDPWFWEARFNLANIYLAQKKVDLAVNQYRQVLKIKPNFTPALNILKSLNTHP